MRAILPQLTTVRIIYFNGSGSKLGAVSNFGDHLNSWLWNETLAEENWNSDDEICFLGIGTVLDHSIIATAIGNPPFSKRPRFLVFGSGVGYGTVPGDFGKSNWRTLAVRGPLTAKALCLGAQSAVTDGAILLGSLARYGPPPDRKSIVFMPHHESEVVGNWEDVCNAAGFKYLSPTVDSRLAVETIRSAKLVLADAMHAAIVADTFRVPWIPLSTCSHINTFKWLDWTLGLGLPYEPVLLPPSSSLEVLREYTLPISKQCFRVVPPTANSAMASFERQRAIRSSASWKLYGVACGKALSGIPRKLYNSKQFAAIRRKDKALYISRAAQALFDASNGTQFLSRESVMKAKLSEMVERMQTIPKVVCDWST